MKEQDQTELVRAIAGMHALLPGAESFMIMAFMPDGQVAVFGDTPKKQAAEAFRRWGRDVLLGKKTTRTIATGIRGEKQ